MIEQTWQYEPAADIDQTLADRLRQFPREPDMLVYTLRALAAFSLRFALRIYHRLQICGRENLPANASFVLVANHSSHLDALCLLSALRVRQLHRAFPVAAQDYFFVSLPRVAAAAIFVNAMPFARQIHMRQSLDLCRELLAKPGNILILFPEGTRTPTGAMGAFRAGIGSLLAGTSIPVIPCGIQGSFAALPKGSWFPRPRRVRLVIGKPREYSSVSPCRKASHDIASELQEAVRELSCR